MMNAMPHQLFCMTEPSFDFHIISHLQKYSSISTEEGFHIDTVMPHICVILQFIHKPMWPQYPVHNFSLIFDVISRFICNRTIGLGNAVCGAALYAGIILQNFMVRMVLNIDMGSTADPLPPHGVMHSHPPSLVAIHLHGPPLHGASNCSGMHGHLHGCLLSTRLTLFVNISFIAFRFLALICAILELSHITRCLWTKVKLLCGIM